MDERFKGKAALITDTASELGQLLFKRLSDAGADVVGTDSPLVTGSDVDSFVREAAGRLGRIDILIHNNNFVTPKSIEHCADSEFDVSLAVNAKSAFLFTRAVGRIMKEQKNGKILYVSSIHDEKPNGADFAYSVAKGAVKMLMREACLDLGQYDVNVNVLSAGALAGDEERFRGGESPLYEHMEKMIPNKRAHGADEIADIALFLCSDESRMINGADLTADGGFLKSYFPRYSYEEYAEVIKNEGHPVYNPLFYEENKLPEKSNAGKVAVVTGSATSIGQGVATALAKEGVKVAVTYNRMPADETMRLIREAGGEAIAVKTDVTDRESVRNLFGTAAEKFGGIDLLVNGAAVQLNRWLLEYTEEQYDLLMRINLKGYFTCIQEALPYLKKNAFPRIINIASVHAERPTNFDLVYSMTKGGVKMLTREAAVEFAKYGVTVNQLNLGAIKVPYRSGDFVPKKSKPLDFKNTPKGGFLSGRYGYPFDVGYIVSFLMDERSQFINGTEIRADGGSMNV